MFYFKIEKSGCCEYKGLCQVRADFYDENIITKCKIIPKEGYTGKLDDIGNPVDMEDYDKWIESLPEEDRCLLIYIHIIYFEPNVEDEEIIFCFELVLKQLEYGIKMKNVKPDYSKSLKLESVERIKKVKIQDFIKIKNASLYSVR